MLTLNKLTQYTPEYLDMMIPALYLQTEDGLDWYYHLTRFQADTMKICFDDNGVIRSFHADASRLFPSGLSVTEIKSAEVPDGLNIYGEWMWNGEKIIPREFTAQEVIAQAESKRSELLAMAAGKIAPLQDADDLGVATDEEKAQLLAWKTYRVRLNRLVFSGVEDIAWPEVPENVA
ncbi:tail fiber assembly protein [Cronobacter turicensis]|nr:tail fiber assembly protein [Cronobacter sakazakii]EMA8648061.1 tail fiber assembly protein [Cronobacter turicensis]EGT5755160.1 tail fiber assembly protein [Cronobacter sakazakii]EJG0817879.1 tail fiber assembly protein [Cronobacter sakazakii]EJG2180636.1 tail fiber assembly protein [Cronobacter sakazakii]